MLPSRMRVGPRFVIPMNQSFPSQPYRRSVSISADGRSALPIAPARSVLFCLLFAVFGSILLACSNTNADEAPRNDDGSVVGAGEVGVNRLRLGDCFNQESDVVGSTSVEAVEAVPCEEAHDQEVFYLGALPDNEYAGDQVTADLVTEQCIAVFETYVGLSYTDSVLDIAYIYPSEDSWGDGDRGYVCSLFDVSQEALVGSMRGAAR